MRDECFKQEVERFNQWRKALIMMGVCLSGWKWDLADMAKGYSFFIGSKMIN